MEAWGFGMGRGGGGPAKGRNRLREKERGVTGLDEEWLIRGWRWGCRVRHNTRLRRGDTRWQFVSWDLLGNDTLGNAWERVGI